MNNFFRKLELENSKHTKLLTLLRKANELITKHDSTADSGDYWAICEYRSAEVVTDIDFKNHTNDICRPLLTSYQEIVDQLPELDSFLKTNDLELYLGKVIGGNFGIHKHVFSPSSMWNLCVMDTNTDGTTVGFYTRNVLDEPVPTDSFFYNHITDKEEVLNTEEILQAQQGDIFSFNVWQWHSFEVPDDKPVDVYLMYFKNSSVSNIDTLLKNFKV